MRNQLLNLQKVENPKKKNIYKNKMGEKYTGACIQQVDDKQQIWYDFYYGFVQ